MQTRYFAPYSDSEPRPSVETMSAMCPFALRIWLTREQQKTKGAGPPDQTGRRTAWVASGRPAFELSVTCWLFAAGYDLRLGHQVPPHLGNMGPNPGLREIRLVYAHEKLEAFPVR